MANGDRYALVLPPESTQTFGTQALCIHKLLSELDFGRVSRYSHLSIDDIKATVQPLGKTDLCLVDKNSVLVYVMSRNAERFESTLSENRIVADKWYAVESSIVDLLIREIDQGFFRKWCAAAAAIP